MAYVKLDTGIIRSTIWMDPDACKVFLTALLMAEPYEVAESMPALNIADNSASGFVVPPGWYGLVAAAGPAISHHAMLDQARGTSALERLAAAEIGSKTPDHDGRRMVRVSGGYLVLNYILYRDKDHTAAVRQARFRARKKMAEQESNASNAVTITGVTHADEDEDEDIRAKAKKERVARGARLPADWQPSDEDMAWGRNKRPDIDVANETENFCDHWHSATGPTATKIQWRLAWRKWIRGSRATLKPNGASHGQPKETYAARITRKALAERADAALDRSERPDDAGPVDLDVGVLLGTVVKQIR